MSDRKTAGMKAWRHMDDAPRHDRTRVLLFLSDPADPENTCDPSDHSIYVVGFFEDGVWRVSWSQDAVQVDYKVDRWMPLPAPPEAP